MDTMFLPEIAASESSRIAQIVFKIPACFSETNTTAKKTAARTEKFSRIVEVEVEKF